MVTAISQYRYFLSLDKTVKVATALYVVLLLGGTGIIWIGIERLAREFQTHPFDLPLLFGVSMVLAFSALLFLAGKLTCITDIHVWLDKAFFRLLHRSNQILFDGLVVTLEPGERNHVSSLEAGSRGTLLNSVFNGLADNNSIFSQLLETGIFRLWIWYWVALYGTFVFTILTTEFFSLVLKGIDQYARDGFTICWALALAHLAFGILLGSKLGRMMGDVASLLVQGHRGEIAAMLRKNMHEAGTPADQGEPHP